MTRIESELHDLYECLMRNDDMADRDTYNTIVGIANEVAEVEVENERLRELIADVHEALCADKAGMFHRLTLASMQYDMSELGIEVGK